MANVSIPQERDESYYRLTVFRHTVGQRLIYDRLSEEEVGPVLKQQPKLGRTVEKIEHIHVKTTVTVRDATEQF